MITPDRDWNNAAQRDGRASLLRDAVAGTAELPKEEWGGVSKAAMVSVSLRAHWRGEGKKRGGKRSRAQAEKGGKRDTKLDHIDIDTRTPKHTEVTNDRSIIIIIEAKKLTVELRDTETIKQHKFIKDGTVYTFARRFDALKKQHTAGSKIKFHVTSESISESDMDLCEGENIIEE
ncbi:hypothetical protein NDU88_003062 [Pleurodeles waltl]|uniref:Uncharacterized protein n=1 Tax=Pleurodeles waltl TaxID=8319 RepID=A0AAV7WSH4_PLEWA|nr:hypothetical protein NDU88_003062 [Pleurodeles waltl]